MTTPKTPAATAPAIDGAAPMLERASTQIASLAQDGMDAVRGGSRHLRESAQQATRQTVGYIRQEPVKAMLMAAATGAVLMALIGLVTRSRDRR
jgi:ElaB/YqjD/DUF883 family membrane-anchored ribosome-binding protein